MERAHIPVSSAGKMLKVGIIDAGIYPHKDYRSRLLGGIDFTGEQLHSGVDLSGHGTYIAGIICGKRFGICRSAYLFSLKAVKRGAANFDKAAVTEAVLYAELNDIKILNLCSGFDEYDGAFECAVAGFSGLLICSAGNTGRNLDLRPRYPQCFNLDNVICVAALGRDGKRLPSSNYGEAVSLYAPGEGVYTTVPGDGYAYKSGTSVAAPAITAHAARIWNEFPSGDALKVKRMLLSE